jgi:anti-sigma regulatory factor (Ser/Thr protein kinase)
MGRDTAGLRHAAFVYEDEDEYVDRSVSFLRAGLAAGEAAVVAHTRPGLALVRDALGPDAAEVTFVDVSDAYTRPARTLASYHEVYVRELRRAPAVRAVADVQFGPDLDEWGLWAGYEAAFTRSFAHLPAWVLCSYAGASLPDRIRADVARTHPEMVSGSGAGPSPTYEEPERVLRQLRPGPRSLPGLRPIPVAGGAEAFREHLARAMVLDGVPPARAVDMLLASTEVFVNGERHGGGVVRARGGRADGRFVCEIVDRGRGFDDPLAGYLAPRPGRGAGLWVARQLTWQIDLFRAVDGFTVRVWL